MTAEPVTINIHQTINEAIQAFSSHNFYGIPVTDDQGFLQGMITKSSIMLALYNNQSTDASIQTIMETSFDYVSPLDPLKKAVKMREGCLPVITSDGKLTGIITRTDLLKARSIQVDTVQNTLSTMTILQQVLDSTYEGVVVVNHEGKITEINEAYCKLINQKKEDVLHHPVEEVIDNTRLQQTCKSGIEERNQLQRINGQDMLVHRIPLTSNDKVIGAMGLLIYRDVDEMFSLTNKLSESFRHPDLGKQAKENFYLDQIIGSSAKTLYLKKQIAKIAPLPSNVLITGASGTGKELCAKTIHQLSQAASGKFVAINCSAIPENLLESELFGYVDGAFTGALRSGKKGKFELAEGGTIFLDEIGDMPLYMQAKLLRVLQEKTIEPIGADFSKKINVRVIAATNQDLAEKIAQKEFRADLFYRLNILAIELPVLRQNTTDISELLEYYLHYFADKFQKNMPTLSTDVYHSLINYSYPGNIRELANLCEALVGLCENDRITLADLPARITADSDLQSSDLSTQTEQSEKEIIRQTLKECGGNKTRCAKILKIQRSTLYNKIRKYGL
ncbi:MAG TPA: sigma 54-interacting transcriptional regulator [Candidatus Ligilactobacillus excrementipullorum]|nr:sigma 54-interacting transcriptional regulator [Candidatus Ligilactobacillus excrementipullorum]